MLLGAKDIATRNKGLATRNKKLLETINRIRIKLKLVVKDATRGAQDRCSMSGWASGSCKGSHTPLERSGWHTPPRRHPSWITNGRESNSVKVAGKPTCPIS